MSTQWNMVTENEAAGKVGAASPIGCAVHTLARSCLAFYVRSASANAHLQMCDWTRVLVDLRKLTCAGTCHSLDPDDRSLQRF
jgi:hypothetical protein